MTKLMNNKAFTADDGLLGNIPGLAYCQSTDIQPNFSAAYSKASKISKFSVNCWS